MNAATGKKVTFRRGTAGRYPSWVRPAVLSALAVVLLVGVFVAVEYGGSPIQVRGGVGIVTVTDARPGDTIEVLDQDKSLAEASVDDRGTAIVQELTPGTYDVVQKRGTRTVIERTATVLAPDDHPDPDFFEGHTLEVGRNMIETRDGTTLSAYVHLPGPVSEGPYPTVVELSGYRTADDDVAQPATSIARSLGYATVGVNLRGSGCSGGAFEMLSPTQAADGYDIVETVARQIWVRGGSVGLVGFSYGGLGALEAASTAPPSLNSVTALSIYGHARNAFHPGGLSNSGFPTGWMNDLTTDAQPSGTQWVRDRIAGGDTACERNQLLHGHTVDLADRYLDGAPDDGRFDVMSPTTWAPSIAVPVFLAGQLQDATLGNDLADMFDSFDSSPFVRMVLTNGAHGDGVSPQVLRRMDQFLSLYAASEIPDTLDTAEFLDPENPEIDLTLLPDGPDLPIILPPDLTLQEAQIAYETNDPVEVLFESGNGGRPGAAAASTSMTFSTWPPEESIEVDWNLGPEGMLDNEAHAEAAPVTILTDPSVSELAYDIEGSDLTLNAISPWLPPSAGTATAWTSAPMAEDLALVGSTELDLWLRADQIDVDLQATLAEVDPDGNETLIQTGWRRASDADPAMIADEWVKIPVRLGPIGHLLRAGSRLTVIVGTPGDGQVEWSFDPPPGGPATVDIGQGGEHQSVLMLPTIDDVTIDAPRPKCGTLRAQPCRPHRPLTEGRNRP
ncbi:MAG: CocE/NonD family hydrolase [Aquihabitans sp.]